MTLELTPVEVLPPIESQKTSFDSFYAVGFLVMSSDLLEAVMISNSGSNRSPEKKAVSILKAIAVALRHHSMDSKYDTSPLRAASWLVAQYIEAQAIACNHEYR